MRWPSRRKTDDGMGAQRSAQSPRPTLPQRVIEQDDFDAWGDQAASGPAASPAALLPPDDAHGSGPVARTSSFGWDDDAPAHPTTSREPRREHRSDEDRTPTILVVCTGNVCRSPYIERRLAHAVSGLGIEVTSAGTAALTGRDMEPESAALLDAAGIPREGFRARQVTSQMILDADLVLTAAREHRREIVRLEPEGLPTTFTLHDLADLLEGLEPDQIAAMPGRNVVQKLVAAGHSRRGSVHPRTGDGADVVDPFHRGTEMFATMQAQADPSVEIIARLLRATRERD